MATYKALQLAKSRNHGTFKNIKITLNQFDAPKIFIEFYNTDGKFHGANMLECKERKWNAKEQFMKMLAVMLDDFKKVGWDNVVSFDYDD